MIFEIPTDSRYTTVRQTCALDGSAFVIDLEWSDKSSSWYLSLYRQTDTDELRPVVLGVRLSVSWPLLTAVLGEDRPAGQLFAVALDGGLDPARDELGERVKLYYYDRAELDG